MPENGIHEIELNDEFKICPVCGYRDGFHSAFKKQDEKTLWLFVCPSCHSTFDIGLTV